MPWRRKWQPTPVFLPGESHGQRSLAGYSPWGRKEWDSTEQLSTRSLPGPSCLFTLRGGSLRLRLCPHMAALLLINPRDIASFWEMSHHVFLYFRKGAFLGLLKVSSECRYLWLSVAGFNIDLSI